MININRIFFKFAVAAIVIFFAIEHRIKKTFKRYDKKKLGILSIEFFHKELGGFGGYGKSTKNVTDYFNSLDNSIKVEVLLTRASEKPLLKNYYNTDVLIAPDPEQSDIMNTFKYTHMLNARNINFLMTIEYCTDYQYSLFLLPCTPVLIWIHDPRPTECLAKIATVSLEVKCSGGSEAKVREHEKNIRDSINSVVKLSKMFKRKIVFASTTRHLIDLAKKLYNLESIEPVLLPTAIDIPVLEKPGYSHRPSVCFLGRLDPIKRPWIFFELAKRFKDIDFFVAGKTNFPEIMDPVINKYKNIENLKFMGMIDGKEKHELLNSIWITINTSIHEALPVSFLESFSYGKPVISCQNPDGLVEEFGEYTGELLGDGFDQITINAFADALNKALIDKDVLKEKGMAARKYVNENCSFKKFEETMNKIMKELLI